MTPDRSSGARRSVLRFLSVAIPKLLNSAGLIAVNALLVGYMDSAQYGVLGVCTAILLVIDSVIGSAVDMGVIKLVPACLVADPRRANSIQATAFVVKIAAGLGAAALLLAFRDTVSITLFHSEAYAGALVMTLVASMAVLALRSAQASLQVTGHFGSYGSLDMLSNGIKYGGVAVLALTASVTLDRVLLLYAAGPAVAFVIGVRLTPGILRVRDITWPLVCEFSRVVSWFLITFGSAALAARADLFILSARTNAAETGMFVLAGMVPLGAQLFGSYLSVLLSPNVTPLLEAREFYPFFRTTQALILIISGAFLLVGAPAILTVGPYLLPAAYLESVPVAAVMMPGAAAALATFPLTLSFVMFWRPRFLILLDCCTVPFLLILHWTLAPIYGALGVAAISSGTNLLRASFVQGLAWQWARQSNLPILGDIAHREAVST